MTDASDELLGTRASEPGSAGRVHSTGSLTRGFLFADLRDYTRYLESHGAVDAADLLVRYRTLVRKAVAEYDGAEIKTEGDSFYVVFQAVSAAVLCGLAILDAAPGREDLDGDARLSIPVGIGIHAGETVVTPDGYVGSAVNIAARICAIAKPGEVLVSDTVRALTQTVLPVTFTARGRQKLKGVAEPVAIFAVAETANAWATQRGRWFKRRRPLALGAVFVSVVLVVGVFGWTRLRPATGLPPGPWTIGMDMPLTGDVAGDALPVRNAVKLAIDEANARGGVGGQTLTLDERDDGSEPNGGSPEVGAANVSAFVANPRTVAVIGSWKSEVAASEIPITNAAGLLQCSPANTYPLLTKPRLGALDLRKDHPDRINYIRTAPADDIQGTALASFILHDLHVGKTLVVDDAEDDPLFAEYARRIADWFTEAYTKQGGTVVRLSLNQGADPSSVLDHLSDPTGSPGAVVFGGFGNTAAPLRKAMTTLGHPDIPLLSWDTIYDGSGQQDQSFIQLAGTSAAGTYASHASMGPSKHDFADRFRAVYGSEPNEVAAAAYGCMEVILDTLGAVAKAGVSADGLREAVRAYAVDPDHRYDTAVGTLGFDKNGDSTQQFVTFYRVDPSAAGGKGDWVIAKQQDYGPAP